MLMRKAAATKKLTISRRLIHELEDYPSYVNPLAILSIEIYKVDVTQLESEDIIYYRTLNL